MQRPPLPAASAARFVRLFLAAALAFAPPAELANAHFPVLPGPARLAAPAQPGGDPLLVQVQDRFGLFGSLEFRAGELSGIPNWTAAMARIESEQAAYRACDADVGACTSPRMIAWRSKIQALRGRFVLAQLQELNEFVNDLAPYRTDADNYGVSDYWASPAEFLTRAGDCEDYAIIKMVSLLALGFSNDQMRIAVVVDTLRNLPHAVLTVEAEGRTYILDSLFDIVVTHDRITQYVPQYSVNFTTRWAHIVTPELLATFRASRP